MTGAVKDKTGAPLAGVTVVATSPVLKGTQAELTDDSGQYTLTGLRPGLYTVTFFYSEIVLERKGIDIGLGRQSKVNQTIDIDAKSSETITISGRDCFHLTTDCRDSLVVDKDYIRNVPLPTETEGPPCR